MLCSFIPTFVTAQESAEPEETIETSPELEEEPENSLRTENF